MGRLRNEIIKRCRRFLHIPPNYIGNGGCIRTAASFTSWNQVPGDYLEFGVWKGHSFAVAYREIMQQRANHISLNYSSPGYDVWKTRTPRFFAFDSFEGLPEDSSAERMIDYQPGSYSCSELDFSRLIARRGVQLSDVVIVKGWYDKTCVPATKQAHELDKVSIALIDCDLYESTVPVLDFLTDIVQQGTILIFDDWYRFRGDPNSGEQRACREWLERNPHIELIEYWKEAPQAVSFIVNLRGSPPPT